MVQSKALGKAGLKTGASILVSRSVIDLAEAGYACGD